MNYSTLTLALVGIFFALNLAIGLWFGRKSTDIKDYALANKSYGVGPLVMTYIATIFGGGYLFVRVKDMFNLGVGSIYSLMTVPVSIILAGKFIAPRMTRFKNCLNLGDMIGQLYGGNSKILAGLLIFLFNCIVTGMNVSFLGLVFQSFLGLNAELGILIGGVVVGLYSSIGGVRAITSTDIFQFAFLTLSLILIAIFAIQKVGSLEVLLVQMPSNKLRFFSSEKVYYFLTLIISDIVFFRVFASPACTDRILMAKSPYDARKMLYISGVILGILVLILAIISFSALIINPSMDPSGVILYLVESLLPDWLKGVAIVGILAIIFSSADSYMHSSGVAFSRNILQPIRQRLNLSTDELKWAKIGTSITGVLAISFAMLGEKLFRPDYWASVLVPVLSAPLLLGIFGIKPEKKAFWISAAAAASSLIVCKMSDPVVYPIISSMSLVIATCTSAITYLAVNIQMNGGLYYVETDGYSRYTTHEWIPKPKKLLSILSTLLTYPLYFAKRSKEKLQKYGASFEIFGAFYCVVLILPYFLWPQQPSPYNDFILYLRLLGVFLCALLMTTSIWPKITLNYLPAFWYLSLTYCLPFLSTLMLLLTNGSVDYILHLAINIMFLLLLVDRSSALGMGVFGSLLAIILYKYGIVPQEMVEEHFSFGTKYMLLYQIFIASAVGLLFSGKKESLISRVRLLNANLKGQLVLQRTEIREAISLEDRINRNLTKKEVDLLPKVEALEKSYQALIESTPHSQKIKEEYTQNMATLSYIQNVIKESNSYLKLKVEKVELDTMLSFVNEIAAIYSHDNYSIVTQTSSKEIECDQKMLQNVLYDSVEQVSKNNPNQNNIMIDLSDTKLKFKLKSLPNYEKILDAYRFTITTAGYLNEIEFKEVYECEFNNPKEVLPLAAIANRNEILGEIMNKRIIAAHAGVSEVIDQEDSYTHIYVVPKRLREIRHLPLDLPLPNEVIVTWPGALDLEKNLKEQIKQRAPKIDLHKIDRALDVIKKYHAHQTRKSGEPYYLHPVHVALIELEWSQEEDAILGALMHDLLEDTAFTIFDIKAAFGDRVAEVVFGVSKLDLDLKTFHSNKEHLMTLEQSNDFAVLSIKVSDRLHNMRTISGHKSDTKRKAIAAETLKFFVPLAKKLGLDKAHDELKSSAMEISKGGKF